MKIGILSMQRVCNYGSFLQAWALSRLLSQMGHEVCFVDFTPGPCLLSSPKVSFAQWIQRKVDTAWRMRKKSYRVQRRLSRNQEFTERFEREYWPLLGLTKERRCRVAVDMLVIGSDEVFHCTQKDPNIGYAKELFGDQNSAKKVISFAASFGQCSQKQLREAGVWQEISRMLGRFAAISVRDQHSSEMIRALTGRTPQCHLDPVFLYDFTPYVPQRQMCNNTILIYAYASRLTEKEIQTVKAFAKREKKQLLSVGIYQPFCDKVVQAPPFELLGYVRDADYIITDTFHGTVFSIKYYKRFCVFVRESNRYKLEDLLQKFSLSDRKVKDLSDLERILSQSTDEQCINQIIYDSICQTNQYFGENLTVM